MKDAVATMGGLLPEDVAGRDAVHVAVFSAVAMEDLRPGQSVALVACDGSDSHVKSAAPGIGIVDPFLQNQVRIGDRFWVYLNPRTITSLAHRWTHPAFKQTETTYAPPSAEVVSEKWIRDFAELVDLSYRVLMEGARDWVESKKRGSWGEYLCFGGLLEGMSVPDEFWEHYERVTGEPVAEDHRGSFFTCSC